MNVTISEGQQGNFTKLGMVVGSIRNLGSEMVNAESGETSPLMAALALYSWERDDAAARARKQLGVNELDARALAYVSLNPGVRPSELAGHLGVTSAGITTMVERLVRRGIMRRQADENDRRVNHIHLAVDLEKEPWSQLAHFQGTFRAIVEQLDPQAEKDLAAFLRHATLAAKEQAARVDRAAVTGVSAA